MVAKHIVLLASGSAMPHRGIALPLVALFVVFRCFVDTCMDAAAEDEQR